MRLRRSFLRSRLAVPSRPMRSACVRVNDATAPARNTASVRATKTFNGVLDADSC
jgi:hypothetical protein